MSKSSDFNIYYLNFSKVYEIAMMINNVILTKIQRDKAASFEKEYGFTSSTSAKGTKLFLDGIKASISSDTRETSFSSSKVVETLDVKTTKSILLRRVIEQCSNTNTFAQVNEGDLVKVDSIKLELMDEDSLRALMILRREAFKGMRVEGLEFNNLISSMLQDYSYILKGTIAYEDDNNSGMSEEIIIKIPSEIQSEFENKYSINDLLIGHVSLVGIYKGLVSKAYIAQNTFTYLQELGSKTQSFEVDKIILSGNSPEEKIPKATAGLMDDCHFIDILAIIQDVSFNFEDATEKKLHWWNRLGIWLSHFQRN